MPQLGTARNDRIVNALWKNRKWFGRASKGLGGIGTATQAWSLGTPVRNWQRGLFSKYVKHRGMYPTPPSSSRKRGRSVSFGNLGRGKRLRFTKPSKKRRMKYRARKRAKGGKVVVHNSSYNLPIVLKYKKQKQNKYITATKQKYLLKYNGAFAGAANKGNKT